MRDDWSNESLDKIVKDFWLFILKMKAKQLVQLFEVFQVKEHLIENDVALSFSYWNIYFLKRIKYIVKNFDVETL